MQNRELLPSPIRPWLDSTPRFRVARDRLGFAVTRALPTTWSTEAL
jgi:hypothetical protein